VFEKVDMNQTGLDFAITNFKAFKKDFSDVKPEY
jgi:hypothetical protein